MKKIIVFLVITLLLSSCQASGNVPVTGNLYQNLQETLTAQNQVTSTPFPTLPPNPTATPTPLSQETQAENQAAAALKTYFAALVSGNVDAAAQKISTFSLEAFNMTATDAATALNTQLAAGTHWSNLRILGSSVFNAQTVLVHVRYSEGNNQVTQEKDEIWPMRLENNAWLYNWNNLIDFHTLTISPQTTNGVTVMPTQMRRYTDHLDLILLFQNNTKQPVVFGQTNEILAIFQFRNQSVQANQKQYILDALRSYPDITISITGLYLTYPDSVIIRKWKNYNVKPWYTFNLQ